MSPSRLLLQGLLSHERSDTESMLSCTAGCTAAACVPARNGCSGASRLEHSSHTRWGSRTANLGGSSMRLWQQLWQKILPHILGRCGACKALGVSEALEWVQRSVTWPFRIADAHQMQQLANAAGSWLQDSCHSAAPTRASSRDPAAAACRDVASGDDASCAHMLPKVTCAASPTCSGA